MFQRMIDDFKDSTGTALRLTSLAAAAMLALFLSLVARRIDERPEDRKDGEIAEGAGELGFFPPRSIWPLACGGVMVLVALGPVFGWWLLFLGAGRLLPGPVRNLVDSDRRSAWRPTAGLAGAPLLGVVFGLG